MATLTEKMAASLEILKNPQDKTPCVVLNGTNEIEGNIVDSTKVISSLIK